MDLTLHFDLSSFTMCSIELLDSDFQKYTLYSSCGTSVSVQTFKTYTHIASFFVATLVKHLFISFQLKIGWK